jgi:asparagine synthase (glutamine-hydrolysing)
MRAQLPQVRQLVIEGWRQTPAAWSDLQRRQYVDLTQALPDNLLVKADRMMMAWGLEGRVPFLDHRLVEFGLGLPDKLKVSGRSRQALSQALGPARYTRGLSVRP